MPSGATYVLSARLAAAAAGHWAEPKARAAAIGACDSEEVERLAQPQTTCGERR
jgi:hypothetical protein